MPPWPGRHARRQPERARQLPALAPRKADAEARRPGRGTQATRTGPAARGSGRARRHRHRLVHPPRAGTRGEPLGARRSMRWRARSASTRPSTRTCVRSQRTEAAGRFNWRPCRQPLLRLIESLEHPAYITGRRWDILAWNAAAADIFAFDRLPARGSQHSRLHVHQSGDATPVCGQAGPTKPGG